LLVLVGLTHICDVTSDNEHPASRKIALFKQRQQAIAAVEGNSHTFVVVQAVRDKRNCKERTVLAVDDFSVGHTALHGEGVELSERAKLIGQGFSSKVNTES